jgi:hypothetical protein
MIVMMYVAASNCLLATWLQLLHDGRCCVLPIAPYVCRLLLFVPHVASVEEEDDDDDDDDYDDDEDVCCLSGCPHTRPSLPSRFRGRQYFHCLPRNTRILRDRVRERVTSVSGCFSPQQCCAAGHLRGICYPRPE